METELIPIQEFAKHHSIEVSFIASLSEYGLIEIITVGETQYVREAGIRDLEWILRLHHGLEINFEGIDAIFQLLQRAEAMQQEIVRLKNRLRLYEGD